MGHFCRAPKSTTVNLKWSRPKKGEGPASPLPEVFKDTQKDRKGYQYKYEFELDLTIDIPEDHPEAASKVRLKNMGYDPKPPKPIAGLEDPIKAFQHDYKPRNGSITEDGTLNPATMATIKTTHADCSLVLKPGSDVIVKR
jgi:hypothetical protein